MLRTALHALLLLLLHLFPDLLSPGALFPHLQQLRAPAAGGGGGGCFRRAQTTRAQVRANAAHLLVPASGLGPDFAGHDYAFTHAIADPACPRYVMALQNENAGAGHRVREWAMGVWASVLFNLTMVHWPLLNERLGLQREGLRPEHKPYAGWDDLLGLALGENRSLTYYELNARKDVVKEVNAGGFQLKRFTVPNVVGEARWAHLGDPAACNVLTQLPGNNWVYDLSGPVRPVLQYKFLHAPQQRGAAWAVSLFSPAAVNVAVHYRRGDMVPTAEFTLWRIVAAEVLPALRLARVRARVHIHVFADSGANASDFSVFPKHFEVGRELFFHFLEDPVATLYNLAHSDIFVGSRSSFSWMVALVSSQPYCLMQTMDPMHEFCPAGSGCCTNEGECVSSAGGAAAGAFWGGRPPPLATARRTDPSFSHPSCPPCRAFKPSTAWPWRRSAWPSWTFTLGGASCEPPPSGLREAGD